MIQDDPKFDSLSGTVTFQLVARAFAKLESADASNVGTVITNGVTSPANGDGVTTVFSTQDKSLWRGKNVRVNGVAKTQGDTGDYTINDLNDAETAASLVFNAGSVPGAFPILFDGEQWYRDKSISELVALLCTEAGIGSGDRQIEEPIFAAVDQSKSWDSQADFQGGVYSQVDTALKPGFVRGPWVLLDDFRDLVFSSRASQSPATPGAPEWTTRWNQNGSTNTPGASTGELLLAVGNVDGRQGMTVPLVNNTGQWKFKVRVSNLTFNNPGVGDGYVVMFYGKTPSSYVSQYLKGYGLRWNMKAVNVELVKYNNEESNAGTVLATVLAGSIDFGSQVSWKVSLDGAGLITVYRAGVSVGSVTDTTFTSSDLFGLALHVNGSGFFDQMTATIDDIYYSPLGAFPAVLTLAEYDMLAAPTKWLPMTIDDTLNDGSFVVKTNVASSSGGAYDGALALDAQNTPTSAFKQFVKVTVEFSDTATDEDVSMAEIGKLVLNWRGTSLFVKSADFTGMNCLDAVQELARMGGMEYGQKGDGTFFFRNKASTAVSAMTISQKNVVVAVTNYSPGYRDVKNKAQVRYGESGSRGYYFAEYGATESGEASPTSAARFGERVVSYDLQRFIFSNDAQVAAAIAQKLYTLYYLPKRKLKLRCRIMPQVDLSDIVTVSFHDSPLIEKAIYGDPLQKWPVTGANARTLARDILMKIVGHSPDILKSENVLDLEEVI